jgi:ribosomal protein S18 acetylase RimI-like enzyme
MNSSSAEHSSNIAPAVTLRAALPEDEQFLYDVYASTRADELAQVLWDEAQLKMFLKMQLRARDQSYLMYYPSLDDRIILLDNKRAGRLIVSRTDDCIRLVDVALLPEYRGTGIGTALIKELFAEAGETNRVVRLQVEKTNPQACRLYERLGFSITSENQTHFQMEISVPPAIADGTDIPANRKPL